MAKGNHDCGKQSNVQGTVIKNVKKVLVVVKCLEYNLSVEYDEKHNNSEYYVFEEYQEVCYDGKQ